LPDLQRFGRRKKNLAGVAPTVAAPGVRPTPQNPEKWFVSGVSPGKSLFHTQSGGKPFPRKERKRR